MNYFEQGGFYVAIYFLCVAASATVAAFAWQRKSTRVIANALIALLTDLAYRTLMIGAVTVLGVGAILMIAFPQAIPAIAVHLLGNVVIAAAVVGLVAVATHFAFERASTVSGLSVITAATMVFYVGVAIGMQRLNDFMLERAARARDAKAVVVKERARIKNITLETREQAIRKKLPLEPQVEPYVSLYRCVEPLLVAQAATFRAERRWPRMDAEVAAIARDARCRLTDAGAQPSGGIRVTTEDETLPPWGRKVARKPAPFDPPLPPLQIYFLPVTDSEGAVLWLCTAPHQPNIATRFAGCGLWTPAAHAEARSR